MRHMY